MPLVSVYGLLGLLDGIVAYLLKTSKPALWRHSLDTFWGQWEAAVEPVQVCVEAVVAAEILLCKWQ